MMEQQQPAVVEVAVVGIEVVAEAVAEAVVLAVAEAGAGAVVACIDTDILVIAFADAGEQVFLGDADMIADTASIVVDNWQLPIAGMVSLAPDTELFAVVDNV